LFSGLAPLHLAIQEDHEMTVKVLLQSGANPNLRTQTKDRQPPVNLAVSEMVKYLLDYSLSNIESRNSKHRSG
jgi:ankyrin repeat protein